MGNYFLGKLRVRRGQIIPAAYFARCEPNILNLCGILWIPFSCGKTGGREKGGILFEGDLVSVFFSC